MVRFRVERNPALCGHLNGEVGNLCGVLNFGNKSCVLCALIDLLFKYLFITCLARVLELFR